MYASGIVTFDWLEDHQLLHPTTLSNRKAPLNDGTPHICKACGKNYTWRTSLNRHIRDECGKEPRFPCPYCPHKSKRRGRLIHHIARMHQS